MIVGRFEDQSREEKLRDIIYSDWLRDGETISSVVASFERTIGDEVETIPFAVTAAVISGSIVRIITLGGYDLSEYKVTLLLQTTLQKREDEVIITIREV